MQPRLWPIKNNGRVGFCRKSVNTLNKDGLRPYLYSDIDELLKKAVSQIGQGINSLRVDGERSIVPISHDSHWDIQFIWKKVVKPHLLTISVHPRREGVSSETCHRDNAIIYQNEAQYEFTKSLTYSATGVVPGLLRGDNP